MADPEKLTTIVSTKGQVILPETIRRQRRWDAGTRLLVEDTPDGVPLKSDSAFARRRPEDVFASLPYSGAPKTIEDMEAGIVAEAKRRHARG
jgi:AbrB family looped-hinge helix DNA binding protein